MGNETRKNIWFTSDLHFGHFNIIRYCDRPYTSAEKMNEELITNWNTRVADGDTVYILGDIFMCNENEAVQIMHRLNGGKRLVYGNHDRMIRKTKKVQDCFEMIYPDLHDETIEGQQIIMCHYPLLTWNKAGRGAWHLHGHQHNKIANKGECRRYDVGVDANGYAPVMFQEIKRVMDKINPDRMRDV